jgi:beta-lactamase superfamily II metal-dependent hydrolase
MRIDIHDVGHGHCSVITCPNGAQIMIDCGYGTDPDWFPSTAYNGRHIALLAFSNLDEDHVDDLPYVWEKISIGSLFSNPTISASALAAMKRQGGMGRGVQAVHSILEKFGAGLIGTLAEIGEVTSTAYWNRYGADFNDTNNLSPAIFVRYGSFAILFAGDLETAGWRALLRNPNFVRELASVRMMVASHHGRANGQSEELFELMRPDVVVFSDDDKRYQSQATDAWYRRRVFGLPDFDRPTSPTGFVRRHVLTTRRDGSLAILVNDAGGYLISPGRRPLTSAIPNLQATLAATARWQA